MAAGQTAKTHGLNVASRLPLSGGVNYAPLQPLLDLKARESSSHREHYLTGFIQERLQHYRAQDEQTWKTVMEIGRVINLFHSGNHLPARNLFNGSWYARPVDKTNAMDLMKSINLVQFFFTNNISRWLASQPKIEAQAGTDGDEAEAAAHAAQSVIEHYQQKFYTAPFDEQDCLNGQTFGTIIHRVRHDAGRQGLVALRSVIENRQVTMGAGMGFCGSCSFAGSAKDFQVQGYDADGAGGEIEGANICPQCKSSAVIVEPPATGEFEQVVGEEEQNLGDFLIEPLYLGATRWDVSKSVHESSWMIHEQRVSTEFVQAILGANMGAREGGDSFALDILDAMARNSPSLDGKGRDWIKANDSSRQTITTLSLGPEDCDVILKGDEQTVSGQKLPTGAKLSDVCDGATALVLGDKLVIGLYADHHKDKVTSAPWYAQTNSGLGRAQADMIGINRRINRLSSQAEIAFAAQGSPGVVYREGAITQEYAERLGRPDSRTPVDMSAFPLDQPLANAVMQLPPGAVSGQMVQHYQQFLQEVMKITAHSTDFSEYVAGAQSDTAAGDKIAAATASAVHGPVLSHKAEQRRQDMANLLRLFSENMPAASYFRREGQEQDLGRWISGGDIRPDVQLKIAQDSHLPQNTEIQGQNLDRLLEKVGGVEGLLILEQNAPDVLNELARVNRVDLRVFRRDSVAPQCRTRLKSLLTIAQQAAALGIPPDAQVFAAVQPVVTEGERDIPAKAKWFSEWLDTPEGLASPPEIRHAVTQFAFYHLQMDAAGQTAQAGLMAQAQMAAQQPMMDAQNEAAAQQRQAQMAAEQEKLAMQQQAEGQKMAMQAQLQGQQMQQQGQEAERQRQHEAQMAEEQAIQAEMQAERESDERGKDRRTESREKQKDREAKEKAERIRAAAAKRQKSTK